MVFPGQGSQSIGMLAELAGVEPVVGETFQEASEVLGYDLWRLCQEGPAERLNSTECTQPAMLVAGVAAWRAWQSRGGPQPAVMAGHSLGEITALSCSGAIGFSDAVALVQFRGRVMGEAVAPGAGAMAAVLGLEDAVVEEACREAAGDDVVVAANYNAPGQVVIAGATAAVARAVQACSERGARRALPLPISVPCHSPLMRPAAERLRDWLAGLTIEAPTVPVLRFDGGRHGAPEAIREGLYHQLASPVRWTSIVAAIIATGPRAIVEAGPGKVLAGLVRRAEGGRQLTVFTVEGADTLAAALAGVRGGAT